MSRVRDLLDAASFEELFLEELGWDRVPARDSWDLDDSTLRRYRR